MSNKENDYRFVLFLTIIKFFSVFLCLFIFTAAKGTIKNVNFVEETRAFMGIVLGKTKTVDVEKIFGKTVNEVSHEGHGGEINLYYMTESNGKKVVIKFSEAYEFDNEAPGDVTVSDAGFSGLPKDVKAVSITDKSKYLVATKSGLSIGADEKWVLEHFGNPMEIDEETWSYYFVDDIEGCSLDYGIYIIFENRKCVSFTLYRRCVLG